MPIRKFQGFVAFKEIVNSGQLPVGAVITIEKKYRGADGTEYTSEEEYTFLGCNKNSKHEVYEIRMGNFPSNARKLLTGNVPWYIKE